MQGPPPITALINAFVPSITSSLSHLHCVIGTTQNSLLFDPGAVNLENVYFRRNRFTYLLEPPEVLTMSMSILARLDIVNHPTALTDRPSAITDAKACPTPNTSPPHLPWPASSIPRQRPVWIVSAGDIDFRRKHIPRNHPSEPSNPVEADSCRCPITADQTAKAASDRKLPPFSAPHIPLTY